MTEARRSRFGFLGGSFDPVHLGHLFAAQDAFEYLALDRVTFVPAAQTPLKDHAPLASAAQRVAMLRAALADDPRFDISEVEIKRGGTSYTIDTARALREQHPHDALYWIIGADQATRLGSWHNIGELARLIEFIVLARPGFSLPQGGVPDGVRLHPVSAHVFDVSASEIRARLGSGKPVEFFLPSGVADLISQQHLYQ